MTLRRVHSGRRCQILHSSDKVDCNSDKKPVRPPPQNRQHAKLESIFIHKSERCCALPLRQGKGAGWFISTPSFSPPPPLFFPLVGGGGGGAAVEERRRKGRTTTRGGVLPDLPQSVIRAVEISLPTSTCGGRAGSRRRSRQRILPCEMNRAIISGSSRLAAGASAPPWWACSTSSPNTPMQAASAGESLSDSTKL